AKGIRLRMAREMPGAVGAGGYGVRMASPSAPFPAANPPPEADPAAIRACLTPRVVAEFDAEWEIVLDKAKQTKDLAGVHKLLHKWRYVAYAEMRDPGSYFRLLARLSRSCVPARTPPPARTRTCRPSSGSG
ncbi:MAG: DUF6247 family protein, partial [Pseudonocardiaceae bacterium]